MRGKYIVLEGAEGVGKTTQIRKLEEALRSIEIPVKVFREPDNECDKTTQVIHEITQDPSYPMNSRTEVLLYNAARSQSLEKIQAARNDGYVCLVDRSYLTTLALQYYGRGDISDYERLNQIIDFAVGKIKPDLMIVLDAPIDVLMARKAQTNETNRFDQLSAPFLERVRSGYLWEARQRDLPIVYALGTTDQVFQDIWKLVVPVLSLKNTKLEASTPTSIADIIETLHTSPKLRGNDAEANEDSSIETAKQDTYDEHLHAPETFYTPYELGGEDRTYYTNAMASLQSTHKSLTRQLTQYLLDQGIASAPSVATSLAERYLRPILPLAALGEHHVRPNIDETVRSLAAKLLPKSWSAKDEAIQLVQCYPRNELDCIGNALYEYCDIPMAEISAMLRLLPYETKMQLLMSFLDGQNTERTLKSVTYQWDLMTDYVTYEDFVKLIDASSVVSQSPSPRFGFDTPEIIEEAGLGDRYADCFDQSLALFSTMQAAGQARAAEYTVLLGHQLRWRVTTNAYEMHKVRHLPDGAPVGQGCLTLIASMLDKIEETHPIISEALHTVRQ